MMIDYKQLRVGNYVTLLKNGEHMAMVTEIREDSLTVDLVYDGLYNGSHRRFEPIPLTPEVLKACGFDYIDTYTCLIDSFCFKKAVGGGVIFHYDHHCNPKSRQVSVTYLHELQNLFYSLTGQELTPDL